MLNLRKRMKKFISSEKDPDFESWSGELEKKAFENPDEELDRRFKYFEKTGKPTSDSDLREQASVPSSSLAPADEQTVKQSASDLQKVSSMIEKFIAGFAAIESKLRQIKESTLPTQWQQQFGKNHPYQMLLTLKQTVDAMVDFLSDFAKKEQPAKASIPGKSTDTYYLPGQMGTDGSYRPGGMTAQGFNFYQQKAKKMSADELTFAIKDLHKTIELQEAGVRNGNYYPKLGFYWDEYWTYLNEQNSRNKKQAVPEEEEPLEPSLQPQEQPQPTAQTPAPISEPLPALVPQSAGFAMDVSPSLLKEYKENEKDNAHTENLELLARISGKEDLIKEAKDILKERDKQNGFVVGNPLAKRRDALEDKLKKDPKVAVFLKSTSSIPADSLSSAVPHLRISYEVWTPEDIKIGEPSERGWEDEDGIEVTLDENEEAEGKTLVDKTVEILKEAGAVIPAEDVQHPWYSTELDHDDPNHRSNNTVFSYFLVGYTPEQEQEVLTRIKKL